MIAAAPASIARLAVVSPSPAIAALADAGALDDPLVGRLDAPLEVRVGDALLGKRGAPACDAGPHTQWTRSQAIG